MKTLEREWGIKMKWVRYKDKKIIIKDAPLKAEIKKGKKERNIRIHRDGKRRAKKESEREKEIITKSEKRKMRSEK